MSHDDIDQQVRTYMKVFAALVALTFITVGVSYIHLPTVPALLVGLAIAAIKASLVALFFMHLIDEKKVIYATMALAVVFFFFELLIPLMSESNNLNLSG